MKTKPLKDIILEHINKAGRHVQKGEIYMIAQQEGYSPETAARQARVLAEEGKILVDYYPGKRRKVMLARYAPLDHIEPKKIRTVEIRDGIAYEVFKII